MQIGDLKIVAIGGSLREGSRTYEAIGYITSVLGRFGCRVHLLDLRTMQLPFCNGDSQDPRLDYPAVAELRKSVREAHALVLATPEYHGGMSGVLKNALDLLNTEHLEGKVTGLISVLGGEANSNALNDLARILRSCHAWVVPHHVAVGRSSKVFTDGRLEDVRLRIRFEELARDLVRSTLCLYGSAPCEIGSYGPSINRSRAVGLHFVGA